MWESLKPLTDRWYVFLPLLAAVAILYILERNLPQKWLKTLCNIGNLLVHAALLVLGIIFGTGMENCLLLLLAAVLLGLVTEGGRRHGI